MTKTNNIRFFWNGLKIGKGQLQKAYVSFSKGYNYDGKYQEAPYVGVSCRGYDGFTPEIHEAFEVKNNTDGQSDYYDKDRFKVFAGHPLFADAIAAVVKGLKRNITRLHKKNQSASYYVTDLLDVEDFLAGDKAPLAEVIQLPLPAPKPDPRAETGQVAKPEPKMLHGKPVKPSPCEAALEAARKQGPVHVPVKVVIHSSESGYVEDGSTYDSISAVNEMLKKACDAERPTHTGGYYKIKFSLFVGADEYEGRCDLLDGTPDTIDGHIKEWLKHIETDRWAEEVGADEANKLKAKAYAHKWRSLLALAMATESLGLADLLMDAADENAELKVKAVH